MTKEISYDCGYEDGAWSGYQLAKDDFSELHIAIDCVIKYWERKDNFCPGIDLSKEEENLYNLRKSKNEL